MSAIHLSTKQGSHVSYSTIIDAMRAVVTDGITVGRPCYGVHDCQGDLPSQQARFCKAHSTKLSECAVEGCTASIEQGHRTCSEEQHRKLETLGDEGRTAMFQLRRRAQRHGVLQPEDSISPETGAKEVLQDNGLDVDEDGICPEKDEAGNTKLRLVSPDVEHMESNYVLRPVVLSLGEPLYMDLRLLVLYG